MEAAPITAPIASTNVAERIKQQITERANELAPLVEEYQQLEAMLKALDGVKTPKRRGRPPKQQAPSPAALLRG